MKPKIRYEIDPHNRLVAYKTGRKTHIAKFRRVIDGTFKIDKNNILAYHVKKSQDRDIPQQIKFRGTWSLDKDHNLVLALDKWSKEYAQGKLTLKGEIIDTRENALLFSVATKESLGKEKSLGKTRTYMLTLAGSWKADEFNRLAFTVEKEKSSHDVLTLQGKWEINKNNQVIYAYKSERMIRKKKEENTITFNGYWDILKEHRITYILNKKIRSQFDFRVSTGKIFERGLAYEIGIGATPAKRTITIFGKWRINRSAELIFETEYEKGRIHSVVFGLDLKPTKLDSISVRLKNRIRGGLEIETKFLRKLLKGRGEVYIKSLASRNESAISAGAGFRW